jgi:hypothetical protein
MDRTEEAKTVFTRAVVGVERGDGECAGGVFHRQRLPDLHLHELPPIQLQQITAPRRGEIPSARNFTGPEMNKRLLRLGTWGKWRRARDMVRRVA